MAEQNKPRKYKINYNEKSRENLQPIPFNEREDFKELSSRGGKASVKKKKEFRHAKELLTNILSQDLTQEEAEKILGYTPEDTNTYAVMLSKMVQIANKGNVKAFESLRDTVGDKPTEEVNLTANVITSKDRELIELLSANIDK